MKVELGYWVSLLEGSEAELVQVQDKLTFEDPSASYSRAFTSGRWDGKKRLFALNKTGGILVRSGLVQYLKECFPEWKWDVQDIRVPLEVSGDPYLLQPPLRDYQEEAVVACVRQRWGMVSIPTGGGKTHVAAALFKTFEKSKALYLIHRSLLAKQIRDYLRNVLGEEIGICASGQVTLGTRVVVGLVQSLYSKRKESQRIRDWLASVEVVIVDECHHVASPSYQEVLDNCRGAKVCIGLSGTVPTEVSVEALMVRGMLGQVISTVSFEELRSKGYVVSPQVTFYKGDWTVGLRQQMKKFRWGGWGAEKRIWSDLRRWYIVENDRRNFAIREAVEIYKPEGGVLVIVDLVEQGERLATDIDAPLVWAGESSKSDLWKEFRAGQLPVLICSPVLDEGMDVSGIRTVVLAGGGKSRRQLLQRIGRGVRTSKGKWCCNVIDLVDDEIPMFQRHTAARREVYQQEGFFVQEKELVSNGQGNL